MDGELVGGEVAGEELAGGELTREKLVGGELAGDELVGGEVVEEGLLDLEFEGSTQFGEVHWNALLSEASSSSKSVTSGVLFHRIIRHLVKDKQDKGIRTVLRVSSGQQGEAMGVGVGATRLVLDRVCVRTVRETERRQKPNCARA